MSSYKVDCKIIYPHKQALIHDERYGRILYGNHEACAIVRRKNLDPWPTNFGFPRPNPCNLTALHLTISLI